MSSKIRIVIPIILSVGTAIIYLHNLSRSVYGGDVGDMVTASYVLGVPHPPGYPLFTILGYLLTRIPLGQTPAFMVGLISVFASVFGALIFYFLILKLTKNVIVSFIASLVLAFSFLFWFYAEIAEVFALNNFFAILILYLAILFYKTKKLTYYYLLVFFSALSLTNHHTIIFIFPSIFLLVLPHSRLFLNKRVIFYTLFLIILGLLPYLYIPIAASKNPVVNWGNVKDVPSFLHLFLRKDYGTFNAGIFAVPLPFQRLLILKMYFTNLIFQLTLPVVFLSLLGGIALYFKDRLLLVSLLISFILTGPIFVGYAGFPLYGGFFIGVYERFFVLSSIFLIILFSFGLLFLTEKIARLLKGRFISVFQVVFVIIPAFLFYYNFPKTDLSNLWLGDTLIYDFMSPLPKNSVLFLSGDTLLFNAWYMHYTRGLRPDVKIVNFNGLAGDKYFKTEQEKFLKKNPKLENEEVIIGTIKEINKRSAVFFYSDIQTKGDKLIWVPYGLGYELVSTISAILPKDEFLKRTEKIWKTFDIPYVPLQKNLASRSLSISDIPTIYINTLLATGNFVLSNYQDTENAYRFYQKALAIDPSYSKTHEILGVYSLTFEKKCDSAQKHFQKAIMLNPNERLPYYFLYAIYKECLKENEQVNNIVNRFEKNFRTNFYSGLEKTIGNKDQNSKK